jgi:Xaa-Pro aminopeptidase
MELFPIDSRALARRRERLSARLGATPAVLFAGRPRVRHYLANAFPFRAASHFLYLAGTSIEGAALLVEGGTTVLFVPEKPDDDELWHGPTPSPQQLASTLGCEVRGLGQLPDAIAGKPVATLPCPDAEGREEQARLVGRAIRYRELAGDDLHLAGAMIDVRLAHDALAVAELRAAAEAADAAHRAGMRATQPGRFERDVRAAMEAAFLARGMTTSYEPIITTHGEVLHQHGHPNRMSDGELILADVGAESLGGLASDVTRCWPVSGRFSATQRTIYEIVLEAQRRAIARVAPGVRYRDVHLESCRAIAEGLVGAGILRGSPSEIVEVGAHALFFPHGVGHLLGMDVHDMEDLGDLAGYAPGRGRSAQFGLSYLRLDRDLAPGMAITIEPGIYVIPAILKDPRFAALVERFVDEDALAKFADVRGIRIEDDVLVTATGSDVLTSAIPKSIDEVERAMRA